MTQATDTREILDALISFDTTSRNSNLALIEYIANFLDGYGIQSQLLRSDAGDKANLFATIGPDDVPGVLLSGHTDVVPVDDQEWSSDPFKALSRDGKTFGRGSCDMKGFIASAMAHVSAAKNVPLSAPIHFAFSYDEEVGCIGGRQLAEHIRGFDVKPVACIVGEPTEMRVATHHKGKKWYRCHVSGHEGHTAMPEQGVNAIEMAADLIGFLKKEYQKLKEAGPFDGSFSPPHTTIQTGLIKGGIAYNMVPRDCVFDFEFRHLPDHDTKPILDAFTEYANTELLPQMKAVAQRTGIDIRLVSEYPGLNTDGDAEVTAFVKNFLDNKDTMPIGFSTEAGLFQAAGVPTVVCGPGSIDQAHKPNEFVSFAQLDQCDAFLSNIVSRCSDKLN